MQKIIISVTNDLTTDQRVHKVCDSLQNMGFEILLVGRKLQNSIPLHRNYQTHRIKLRYNTGFLFYAEYNFRLFFYLLFKKKTILLANDLDTLLANYFVAKLQNKKLAYDSHELFTEVPELLHRPKTQYIWQKIEQYILPKLKNTYTVCSSIANYYNKKYQTNFKIIRNVPKYQQIELKAYIFPFETKHKKIIIYQGALNIGRGLELMLNTMKYLENYLFVIVGDGDITGKLKQQTKQDNLENKVHFLGKKTPEELKKITPLADLGISVEEDLGLNYRFALPNKIFDYIHAEIPVLVSNLPEMKNLVEKYKIGEIITDRNPKKLAKQIENLINKKNKTVRENLQKTALKLQWKNEEKVLKSIFTNLV